MDTGALYATVVGLAFLLVGAVQWFAPEMHRLSRLVARDQDGIGGEPARRHTNSVVRALAVAGMYGAGLFLTLAWLPVFERMYAVVVELVAAVT
jgi:hypothetical protein